MALNQPWITMTREQKMGALFLLVFGVLAVGLGTLQIRNIIYGPFVIHPDEKTAQVPVLDEKTRLKTIDTDHDGLSDYDELYLYGSSPYLVSTASDGVSDFIKVIRGEDPNCPEGRTCAAASATTISTQTSTLPQLFQPAANPLDMLGAAATAGAQPGPQAQASVAEMIKDPAALRQMILSTGKIKKEELDKIDNATLLQFVAQIVNQSQNTAATSTKR